MSKAENLICEHERLRAEVVALKSRRIELIDNCERLDVIDIGGGFFKPVGTTCLTLAFNEVLGLNEEFGGIHNYEEILMNNDSYCQSCIDSYKLKSGLLKEAKHDFGIVKRKISYLGKKLNKIT